MTTNKRYHFSVIAGEISQVTVVEADVEHVGYVRRVREMTEEEIAEMTEQVRALPWGKAPKEWPPRKPPRVTEVGALKWATSGNDILVNVVIEVLDRIHRSGLMPKNKVELRKLIYIPTMTNLEQELTNGKLSRENRDKHEELTRYMAGFTWRQPGHWLYSAHHSYGW